MKLKLVWPYAMFMLILGGCGASNVASESTSAEQGTPQVITLTQTGCQFLESESEDYQFQTASAEDCKKINGETLAERQKNFKPLKLKPGSYIFRVANRDVPYELGFYLHGTGINKVTLPKVSGGGLTTGVTQDYEVTLKPGQYVFSCPLNPTPDYPLEVSET